jgi:hypothetical protein
MYSVLNYHNVTTHAKFYLWYLWFNETASFPRRMLHWLLWTSNEALPKQFHYSFRNTGWLGMAYRTSGLNKILVPRVNCRTTARFLAILSVEISHSVSQGTSQYILLFRYLLLNAGDGASLACEDKLFSEVAEVIPVLSATPWNM